VAYVAPPPVDAPGPVADGDVVDLGPTVSATRIVLDRDLGPLDQLDPDERRRLLVRVLCGLVAYEDEPTSARLAG
jgi:hypothetical protein